MSLATIAQKSSRPGLDDEEKRTPVARALNLARRQLDRDQKRQIIADQLKETPDRTNRVIAKLLGVSHPTVASVRADLENSWKTFPTGAAGRERRESVQVKQTRSIGVNVVLDGQGRWRTRWISTRPPDT